MRFNLKQFFFLSLLIAVISAAIITVVDRGFKPILIKEQNVTSDIGYQKALEGRIEINISKLLEKLYGEKNYVVSVVSHLHQVNEEAEKILYEPVIVSDNFTESYEGSFESFRKALLNKKPSAQEIRDQIKQKQTDEQSTLFVPGLVARSSVSRQISEGLPGFPFIEPLEDALADETDDGAIAGEKEKQDEEKKGTATNSFKKESAGQVVVYNQTKIKYSTPNRTIDKLFVSVLIDEARFKMADIDRNVVEQHINNIAMLNPERGDELVVSVFPFPNKSMDISTMYMRWKPEVAKFIQLIPRFKWVFISFGALILTTIIMFIAFLVTRYSMRKRELKKLDDLREQEESKEKEIKKEHTIIEQKRDDISKLAKTKPQDFARVILNWVEKSEN